MDFFDFRGARGGGLKTGAKRAGVKGRKRCTKGKSCGATCIAGKKKCWVDLPGGEPGSNGGKNLHDALGKVRQKIQGKGSGGVPPAQPQPKPPAQPNPTPQPQPQPQPKPTPQPEQRAVPNKTSQEKKEGAYTPKASNDLKGTKSTRMRNPNANQETDTFEPENLRSKAAEVKADGRLDKTERDNRVRDLERRAAQAERNKEFLSNLEKNLPEGTKVEVYSGIINMSTKTKSGDDVKVSYSPQQGFHFKVNNSLDTGSVADRRAQMEVASAVRKQYDALVQSLPVGAIVSTSAHSSDGKGEGRQRLYERMGFSSNTGIGNGLYAQKQPDGSMAPAGNNPKAAETAWESQRNNPNSLWFSEKRKPSGWERDDIWRALIFGD